MIRNRVWVVLSLHLLLFANGTEAVIPAGKGGRGNISVTEREAAFDSTDRENQGRNGSLTTLAYNLAMMNNFLKVH